MFFPNEAPSYMLRDLVNLFFPDVCRVCRGGLVRNEAIICTLCREALPIVPYAHGASDLHRRLLGRVNYGFAYSYLYFQKHGITQQVLHNIKYRNCPELGVLIGQWYGGKIKALAYEQGVSLILPVPLHIRKQKVRGYNQSAAFARGISKTTGIASVENILKRTIYGESQTQKSRMERWQNVERAFQVADASRIKDQHILLVDDVITTGATIEACVLLLQSAGARQISIGSIAVAL
jgi:ComF family protein